MRARIVMSGLLILILHSAAPGQDHLAQARLTTVNGIAYSRQSTSLTPRLSSPAGVQQTYVVTTTADTGAGSLRKAIHDANLNPGLDIISFNIGSGTQTIQPKTAFEVITDPVAIDATTEPGYTDHPIVELDGTLLVNQTFDNGLEIDAAGCTVKGLIINRFAGGIVVDASGGATIQGCYIGTDASGSAARANFIDGIVLFGPANKIGGTTPGAGNVISGNGRNIDVDGFSQTRVGADVIQGNIIGLRASGVGIPLDLQPGNNNVGVFIDEVAGDTVGGLALEARNIISGNVDGVYIGNSANAAGNVVEGNFIGTDIAGAFAVPNTRSGVAIWAGVNNIIGGTTGPARNVISGNTTYGIRLRAGANGNRIQGNGIGTNYTGLGAVGNGDGVYVKDAFNNLIGGNTQFTRNVISGNGANGVNLDSASQSISITGNYVGVTTINGGNIGPMGNGANGVLINGSHNTIGGAQNLQKNLIQFNGLAGVFVQTGTGNLITQNTITQNGGLGIDLDPAGANPNDPLDADGGPNTGQNYPVIDSVLRNASTTLVKGHLNSAPSSPYTLEFYSNTHANASGYGEGETWIGTMPVTTNANGDTTFSFVYPAVLQTKEFVTATATDAQGNTSEFSRRTPPIRITQPKAGDLFITGERDTIKWVLSDNVELVAVEYSTDGGTSYALISGTIPGAGGELVWVPPKGTIGKHARIHVFDPTDLVSPGDTSGVFRIKAYELTVDSSGEYSRFDPKRHGWNFRNDSTSLWPSSWYQQFNYATGTDPNTGHPYDEFIQTIGIANLFPDWPTWVSAFGFNQCYFDAVNKVARPSALASWYWKADKWKGNCFGFAISSVVGFDSPPTLTASFPSIGAFEQLYDVGLGSFSRKAIHTLYTRQFGAEHYAYKESIIDVANGTSTLQDIKAMFRADAPGNRSLTMWTQDPNMSGAHAVTPYGLERDPSGSGRFFIHIYDNNYPARDTMKVQVDSAAGTWSYNGLPNWNGDIGLYLREPAYQYLTPPTIPDVPGVPPATAADLALYTPDDATVNIVSNTGDTVRYNVNGVRRRIPGSVLIVPETGAPHAPTGVVLPAGGTYSVSMTGFSDPLTRFSAVRDSTVFGMSRPSAQPGETDRFTIGTGFDVANRDNTAKQAFLQTIIVQPGNERVVGLHNAIIPRGDSLHMTVLNRQSLSLTHTGDSLRYDLHLTHASAAEHGIFMHGRLVLPPNSAARFVPDWNAIQNAPVKLLIDRGNTGIFSDSVMLANEALLWGVDASVNTPICTAPGWQTAPVVIADGRGGAIVVWQDQRKGSNVYTTDYDIYAQRISPTGQMLWGVNGVAVVHDTANSVYPRIVSDGAGGVIVVWWSQPLMVQTGLSIRAQRVDSSGTVRWASGGVAVDTYTTNIQEFFSLATDGSGGVIIAAENYPLFAAQAWAQRVDSVGAIRWGAHGIALTPSATSAQSDVNIAPDGAGGIVAGWNDNRFGGTDSAGAVFVQRIDHGGNILWGQLGVRVTHGTTNGPFNIMANGVGGAYVGWVQLATGGLYYTLQLQRLNSLGTALWPTGGIHVAGSPTGGPGYPDMAPDGKGGMILSYEEGINGVSAVSVQRVDTTGTLRWAAAGVHLIQRSNSVSFYPQLVSDGKGGGLVLFQDELQTDLYPHLSAQAVDANGALRWPQGILPVSRGPRWQNISLFHHRSIAALDTLGNALAVWEDGRDSANGEAGQIYGQHITIPMQTTTGVDEGKLLLPEQFRLEQNYPNPFNPSTTIEYEVPHWSHVVLDVYNILGQRIATLVNDDQAPGVHRVVFNAKGFASGVYFCRMQADYFTSTRKLLLIK